MDISTEDRHRPNVRCDVLVCPLWQSRGLSGSCSLFAYRFGQHLRRGPIHVMEDELFRSVFRSPQCWSRSNRFKVNIDAETSGQRVRIGEFLSVELQLLVALFRSSVRTVNSTGIFVLHQFFLPYRRSTDSAKCMTKYALPAAHRDDLFCSFGHYGVFESLGHDFTRSIALHLLARSANHEGTKVAEVRLARLRRFRDQVHSLRLFPSQYR